MFDIWHGLVYNKNVKLKRKHFYAITIAFDNNKERPCFADRLKKVIRPTITI